MKNLIVRYAKREELESVNKFRKQVNEVHVKSPSLGSFVCPKSNPDQK